MMVNVIDQLPWQVVIANEALRRPESARFGTPDCVQGEGKQSLRFPRRHAPRSDCFDKRSCSLYSINFFVYIIASILFRERYKLSHNPR
jgi:hypothetical protein